MNLLNKTLSFKHLLPFIIFLVIHTLLLNINQAEWGDSYRILRAAEILRTGDYPFDEKRPPLFSFILSFRPVEIDPVFWGRIIVFFMSLATFYIFYKLVIKYINTTYYQNLALILFVLNPVYLYWSIRIMADITFCLLVLLTFYLYDKWKPKDLASDRFSVFLKYILLGILAGLGVLTRFEGYLLALSLGIAIFLFPFNFRAMINRIFSHRFGYVLGFMLVEIPYILWRNPITSSYFEEPAGRSYDLKMLLIYIASLLFVLGFIPTFYFLTGGIKHTITLFKNNIEISIFLMLELLLILIWPAAVPRLFVPLIPFLILSLVNSLEKFTEFKLKSYFVFSTLLFIAYLVLQYYLKLQFLIPNRSLFVFNIFLSVVTILLIKYKKIFIIALTCNLLLWSLAVIYLHKDIFISVKKASQYASTNLKGTIAYNDVSSVSDWYLNYNKQSSQIKGLYYFTEKKKQLEHSTLIDQNFDYLLITNEHNTSMTLDLQKRPYLEEIAEFRYNVNGTEFFTKVVKIKKLIVNKL